MSSENKRGIAGNLLNYITFILAVVLRKQDEVEKVQIHPDVWIENKNDKSLGLAYVINFKRWKTCH